MKSIKRLSLGLALMMLFAACSPAQAPATETVTETAATEAITEAAATKAAVTEAATTPAGDLPVLNVSYIFTNHQTALFVAASAGDKVVTDQSGFYLKEEIPKERYTLMNGTEPVGTVNLVIAKSGSETTTMLAQGHVDLSIASNTAFITARDQGTMVKILAPVHTEGIGLVTAKDSSLNNWEDFTAYVEEKTEPVTVGYHSPTSAPLILFESALTDAGISYTKNPAELDKEVLLVDLKGTSNLIPALTSHQVEAWVGPSPYPELAQTQDVGKTILDMRNMPPEGKWYDFPCCVVGGADKAIAEKEAMVKGFIGAIYNAGLYADAHPEEAAVITANFIGIEEDAAKLSTIHYTTDPSENWNEGMKLTLQALKDTDSITGEMKDMTYEEFMNAMYDFRFIDELPKQ